MLSIDGFECAGHPGEDDIGGVVLVSILINYSRVYLTTGQIYSGIADYLQSENSVGSSCSGPQSTIYRFRWFREWPRSWSHFLVSTWTWPLLTCALTAAGRCDCAGCCRGEHGHRFHGD
jgi:hypothetical protein